MISIIIPAYNAENTIKETINSILKQTYQDFEIIVINDGSKDKTQQVLNSINDSRLKIITTENHGVCHARNLGIENVAGEFITFIDADDTITQDYLEKLYVNILDYDLSRCDCAKIKQGKRYIGKELINYSSVITGLDFLRATLKSINRITGYSTLSLYKTSIINKYSIRFKENIRQNEDLLFLCQYLTHANKIYLIKESLYNYLVWDESATGKYMKELTDSIIKVNLELKKIVKFFNDSILNENYIRFVADTVLYVFNNNIKKDNPFNHKQRKIELAKLLAIEEYRNAVKHEISVLGLNLKYLPRKIWFIYILFVYKLS